MRAAEDRGCHAPGHALQRRLELGLREKQTGALVAVFFLFFDRDMLGYLEVLASR